MKRHILYYPSSKKLSTKLRQFFEHFSLHIFSRCHFHLSMLNKCSCKHVPFLYIVKVLHVNKTRTVICSRWDKIGNTFCYLATFTMHNKGIVFTSTFVQHTQMKLTPTENMQRKMFRKSARDLFS